jgi:hypothetical protein
MIAAHEIHIHLSDSPSLCAGTACPPVWLSRISVRGAHRPPGPLRRGQAPANHRRRPLFRFHKLLPRSAPAPSASTRPVASAAAKPAQPTCLACSGSGFKFSRGQTARLLAHLALVSAPQLLLLPGRAGWVGGGVGAGAGGRAGAPPGGGMARGKLPPAAHQAFPPSYWLPGLPPAWACSPFRMLLPYLDSPPARDSLGRRPPALA